MNQNKKLISSCMLGTFICWYDFIIFGLATPLVFHQLFFPNLSFVIPILVFAVGFVIRPLGSIIFGHIGDKIGRKPVLIATMLITGVGTVCIGLLPTYADIGVWATILLVALRIVQSFSLGGEQGAGSTILVEHNIESPKRGFIASVVNSNWAAASLAASGIFALVTSFGTDFFLSYGWRIPFLLSAILVLLCLYMRVNIQETPVFKKLQDANKIAKSPLRELLVNNWKKLTLSIVMYSMSGLYIYGISVFGFAYLVSNGTPRSELSQIWFYLMPVTLFAIVFFGWLGDKIGRLKIFQAYSILSVICVYPIFYWISQGNIVLPILLGVSIIMAAAFGCGPGFFTEMFPANVRQTGSGLIMNVGTMLGGGVAPIIAQLVYDHTKSITSVANFVAVVSVIALVAMWKLGRDKNLIV